MSVQIIKKNQQARGQFNGGEILENKPIGFPREGGHLKPYSNLFYWAHAWSNKGSTIGLHPHQGFEIMSFVMEGSIEHYDSGDEEWKKLGTGAAQIIRSGNGISHSEKLNPGSHMFQIWFDPNLEVSMQKPATYSDYQNESFPVNEENGIKTKVFKGEGSPLQMDSEGVEIYQMDISKGAKKIKVDAEKVNAFYLVKGSVKVEDQELEHDDFFMVKEQAEVEVDALEDSSLFLVSQPQKVSYTTYADRMV
jgi:redox-sensitive bicupin YhaK (pirin superfamily)